MTALPDCTIVTVSPDIETIPEFELVKTNVPETVSLSEGGTSRNGKSDLFFEIFAQVPRTGAFGTLNVTVFEASERPTELLARTVNEYVIPGRSPVRVAVPLPLPIEYATTESGVDITVYDSMVAPPSLPGAVNATATEVFVARIAEVATGASGTDGVEVIIGADGCDATEVPIEFLAITRTR